MEPTTRNATPTSDATSPPGGASPPPDAGPAPDEPAIEPVHPTARTVEEAGALTRTRARDLRTLVSTYIRRHLPARPAPEATDPAAPPRLVGAHARLLPFLRLIPIVLGVLFAVSFAWDFPGVVVTLGGYALPVEGLLRTLAVSGLIGFLTNWLAITMLFNPRQRRPIFGQGLIPAQRERVVYRLAKAVSEELINEEIIKQKIEESGVIPRYRAMALDVARGVLEDPDFRDDLKRLTSDYLQEVLGSEEIREKLATFVVGKIEGYLHNSLGGFALKAYRLVGEDDFQRRVDEAILAIPPSLDNALDEMDHLLDDIPDKLEARSEDIEAWATRVILGFVENLNVYEMVMANMQRYDEKQLEQLIKGSTNEQLNYIKYLGGILGFLGGLVIWQPALALAAFAAVGLVLYGVDVLLLRLRTAEAG